MKKTSKKTKIIAFCIAVIIIVGLGITLTVGLNFNIKYQETKSMQLCIEKNFEISDIKEITNEILPNQEVVIQKVEVFEDTINIIAKEITEEQKTNIIDKVNEKYGTELVTEDIEITSIPNTRARDIIKPYIMPFIIATIIILIYMGIRYHKLGIIKIGLNTGFLLVLSQAVLLSIIAIIRIPIGEITIPMILVVYVFTLWAITNYYEQELAKKKKEEEK